MSDLQTDATEIGQAAEVGQGSDTGVNGSGNTSAGNVGGFDFTERYGDVISKVNQTLDQIDWNQMGRIGKAAGVILAVIVAQILIKGVLDTINLLPVVPGLLELLGLVVVGNWSWKNLTTSEKRTALVNRMQALRQEYLG